MRKILSANILFNIVEKRRYTVKSRAAAGQSSKARHLMNGYFKPKTALLERSDMNARSISTGC